MPPWIANQRERQRNEQMSVETDTRKRTQAYGKRMDRKGPETENSKFQLATPPLVRGNTPLHLDLALGRHLWSNERVCRAELQRELASSVVLHHIGRPDAERQAID